MAVGVPVSKSGPQGAAAPVKLRSHSPACGSQSVGSQQVGPGVAAEGVCAKLWNVPLVFGAYRFQSWGRNNLAQKCQFYCPDHVPALWGAEA